MALLLVGLAVGVAFVRRQSRLAYPLLDLKLFRSAAFSAAITACALTCLAMFGIYIFHHAVPAARAGVVAATGRRGHPAVGAGVRRRLALAPKLVRKLPRLTVMVWGRAGAASALSETASEFSGALGIALFGSAGTVVYRAGLGNAMPQGVPADAAQAALATIGGAVATAQTLPQATSDALLAASRAFFVDALQLAAAVGAAIVAVTCIVTARILRNGGGGAQPGAPCAVTR